MALFLYKICRKSSDREKMKIIFPFGPYPTRNRKLQKNNKKIQKNKKIPLWLHLKPK